MKRRLLTGAIHDLSDIEAHISADSPKAAAAVAMRLKKALDLITARPEIGRLTSYAGVREWSVPGLPMSFLIGSRRIRWKSSAYSTAGAGVRMIGSNDR